MTSNVAPRTNRYPDTDSYHFLYNDIQVMNSCELALGLTPHAGQPTAPPVAVPSARTLHILSRPHAASVPPQAAKQQACNTQRSKLGSTCPHMTSSHADHRRPTTAPTMVCRCPIFLMPISLSASMSSLSPVLRSGRGRHQHPRLWSWVSLGFR